MLHPETINEAHRLIRKDAIQDCLFLFLVVLLSSLLYIGGLGFYHDDWNFLKYLNNSRDQSFAGLSQTLYSEDVNIRQRPVQLLYLAGLYWLFGLQPLGYHLVNAAVLLAGIVFYYLVLREFNQPRLLCLTLPMVYSLLPHYSTDRFWVAAFQATLSMTLYFISVYSVLRALRSQSVSLWGWNLLSLLSLVTSGLAYEVALPLFLLTPILIWHRTRQRYVLAGATRLTRLEVSVLLGAPLLALALVIAFKALTTVRLGIEANYLYHGAHIGIEAIKVNYGTYGLGLPLVLWQILTIYHDWMIIVVAGILGFVIFGYLNYIVGQRTNAWPSVASWLNLIAIGLVLFGLGYAIFLTNDKASFASANRANRVAIAAAVGVGMSFVGGLGWMSYILSPSRFYKRAFCLLVTLLCMCGFLITNTDAAFWVKAYRQQQMILADIRKQFPTLPSESTVILDGACLFNGSAIVFKTSWDLAGALVVSYRDPTIRADVTPNIRVKEDGLISLYHGRVAGNYPYDERLFLYNFPNKMAYQLTNADAVRRYFQAFKPDYDRGCYDEFRWSEALP
jgi:hypothetical protein